MIIEDYVIDLKDWMEVRHEDDEEGPVVDYPCEYTAYRVEVYDISVSCLIATQRLIYRSVLKGMKEFTDPLPPVDVSPSTEEPGYMYIIDGHHRVLKAIQEGRALIKARIYEECIWYDS
jgi:hypothetical protein